MLAIALLLLWLLVLAFAVWLGLGWVFNVIELVTAYSDMAIVEVLIRLAGLPVVFLGSVMGWFY